MDYKVKVEHDGGKVNLTFNVYLFETDANFELAAKKAIYMITTAEGCPVNAIKELSIKLV